MPENFKFEKPREPSIEDLISACKGLGIDDESLNELLNCEDLGEAIGELTSLVLEQTEMGYEEFEEFLKQKGILESDQ